MLDFFKTFLPKITVAFAAAFLLAGCFQETGLAPEPKDPARSEDAAMKVRIRLGAVNALSKGSVITLNKMIVVMTSNATPADTVRDTVTTSNGLASSSTTGQIVTKFYSIKSLRAWKVKVTVRDANDSVTHIDSATTPKLLSADTATINLSGLVSRFAMYDAQFQTIPDSIGSVSGDAKQILRLNRFVLKVDGVTVRDSTANPGPWFTALNTHNLGYDYVSTAPWVRIASGTTKNLNAVNFGTDEIGFIGGDTLGLKTTNGGLSWNSVSGLPARKFRNVSFTDGSRGFFGADTGVLTRTSTGGSSWTNTVPGTVNSSSPAALVYMSNDSGYYVSQAAGTVYPYYTTNGGANWTARTSFVSGQYNALSCVNLVNCWTVGAAGIIRKVTTFTGTFGATQTSGTANNLRSVHFTSVNNGFAVGDGGTIVRTLDGGTSWSTLTSGTLVNLKAVYFVDSLNGYAAGEQGVLLATTNGGSSWGLQASGVTTTLNGLHAGATAGVVYAVGDGGVILKKGGGRVVQMIAYGPMNAWPSTSPLFKGFKTLNVAAGANASIPVTLTWVGPITGAGSITATLVKVGKVTITSTLPGTTYP